MNMSADTPGLAAAALSGLVDRALVRFHRLTGLKAVASVGLPAPDSLHFLLPAVHPRCAGKLRKSSLKPPCEVEWRKHLQFAVRKRRSRHHVCPLGLRCACVPVLRDDQVVGLAKCVAGPETSREKFSASVDLLEVLVARSSQELEVIALREKIGELQRSLELMGRVNDPERSVDRQSQGSTPLVESILQYLDAHYGDHELDLAQVAGAVGRSEKYIAHVFVLGVGTRMRIHITNLRLRRAAGLLLRSTRTIEQIASDSGFARVARFRELFQRHVGVTPSQYRRIFAGVVSARLGAPVRTRISRRSRLPGRSPNPA